MYLFTNRLGKQYEVTEEQKEKIISSRSAEESDFVEIKEEEVEEDFTELQILRAQYKQKFDKNVPVNKSKDAEWIKEKLSSN